MLEMNGREFTWGNNLPIPTFERLDRILCSTEWEEVYPLTQITALTREKSNHTPLFLDSGDIQKSDPIFRFENTWFLREGIDKKIHDVWNDNNITGDNLDRLLGKFRLLSPKLKGWNRNIEAIFRRKKKEILDELDRLDKMEEEEKLCDNDKEIKKVCHVMYSL